MTITGYSRCQCGAITIVTDEGDYSCKARNLRKFFPGIDLRKLKRFPDTFACNHCINHYGLDLCGCGSGAPFGKCNNGFEQCRVPMQVVGAYTRVRGGWADGALADDIKKGTVLAHSDGGLLIISNGTPKWYHEDDITLYTLFAPKNTIKTRIPTAEEWNHMIAITHENNAIIHWKDMFSWVHNENIEKENPSFYAYRGYCSARGFSYYSASYRSVSLGFRPAFDGLDTDALVPDKNGVAVIGTLYMDGKPVKVPQNPVWNGDIESYIPDASLEMRAPLDDTAYQVKGIVLSSGIAIADRVLLANISYEDIENALSAVNDPTPPLKKLWMRAGVSLFFTDEEIERLLTADDEDDIDTIVEAALKDDRWQFDGNSYIPQQVIEEFVCEHDLPYDTDQEPEFELDSRHFRPAKSAIASTTKMENPSTNSSRP